MPSIYQPFTNYEQVEARLIFIYNLGNHMQMTIMVVFLKYSEINIQITDLISRVSDL